METVLRKSLIWVLVGFLALPGGLLGAAEERGTGVQAGRIRCAGRAHCALP